MWGAVTNRMRRNLPLPNSLLLASLCALDEGQSVPFVWDVNTDYFRPATLSTCSR